MNHKLYFVFKFSEISKRRNKNKQLRRLQDNEGI